MVKLKISSILMISFPLILILLSGNAVLAAQVSSQSYSQRVVISSGGENMSSQSYKMNTAVGLINKVVSSASYINNIGFFHTVLLANNQPCTLAFQCEGGFCCSGLCSSSSCPTGGGTSGGSSASTSGGGGSNISTTKPKPAIIQDFSISPDSFKEKLQLGDSKNASFIIKNTGNAQLSFNLNVRSIDKFVSLSENSFILDAGQEKTIYAEITGTELGSFIGEIQVIGGEVQKSVGIVLDVSSQQVLFDVKLDIPSDYKQVTPGSELKAQITLFNVGPARKVDVNLNYIIKDKNGKPVFEESETFPVEKQTSYVKSFKIDESQQPGDYLAVVEIRYQDSFAVSSDLFKVIPKTSAAERFAKSYSLTLFEIAGILALLFLAGYFAVSKTKWYRRRHIEKCYNALNGSNKAADNNEMHKARKLYGEARKQYMELKREHKKEIYGELINLYNRLK